jgi:uncharacterized membrane protein
MDFYDSVEKVGQTIDGAGVLVIIVGAVIAFAGVVIRLTRHEADVYRRFRERLGRTILLGLELLVAGDIVRTVAAKPTLTSVAVLGAIVLIRTFLSFSLEVEITGRWPWQTRIDTTACSSSSSIRAVVAHPLSRHDSAGQSADSDTSP